MSGWPLTTGMLTDWQDQFVVCHSPRPALKREERDGDVGADEAHRQHDQVQRLTDRFIADVDRLGGAKEEEVLAV